MSKNLSVIVGPNASGKSTIFEALRLAKAILFPRMQDELRNVLISLGATSAHFFNNQMQLDISALAGDVALPVVVSMSIEFTAEEINALRSERSHIAKSLISAQLGRSMEDPNFDMRAYFSTEIGKSNESLALQAVDEVLNNVSGGTKLHEVFINISEGQIKTSDTIINLLVGRIEQILTPDKAIFSYFPADRSMPAGEIAIQIGPQDYKAQADSHFSQAISKYGRLKQTVVNQTILGKISGNDIKKEFDSIFETFLPGKEFIGIIQKPTGLIAVQIRNKETNKTFDIDSLSSGEKGLVLSFLLFKGAVTIGSIVLVDELELHLNPAVCRKIVPYLCDSIIAGTGSQFLVSTHSTEIMRDAYEREDAQLFHLRSGTDLSPVLPQDTQEFLEAVTRLGVSHNQALTSIATLFVEGDTDQYILEAAFPKLLSNVQIIPLNGRTEIEKSIKDLKSSEIKKQIKEPQAFLFDNDRKPASHSSTALIRIEQLKRYCIENYLLNEVKLYDFIKSNSKFPPESRGTFANELKEMALSQVESSVTQRALGEYRSIRLGLTNAEIKNKSVEEIANIQFEQLSVGAKSINDAISDQNWKERFINNISEKLSEQKPIWENNWKELCSGKMLFDEMRRKYQINVDLDQMKTTLASNLAKDENDDITALKGIILRLLKPNS
jgi:predicted ATPase